MARIVTRVPIVTVTYNSPLHLPAFFNCLGAVAESCRGNGVELDMVVVDNASSDESVPLTPRYSAVDATAVTLITHPASLGIAAGNNIGVRRALERGADYILLLNNDGTFEDDLVVAQLDTSQRWDPDQVMVSPQILLERTPDALGYDGGYIERYRAFTAAHERLRESRMSTPRQERLTRFATAYALLVPGPVFESIGLMDEDFFVCRDDVDFAIRARKAGLQVVVTAQAVMTHKVAVAAAECEARSERGGRRRDGSCLHASMDPSLSRLGHTCTS